MANRVFKDIPVVEVRDPVVLIGLVLEGEPAEIGAASPRTTVTFSPASAQPQTGIGFSRWNTM